MTHGDEAKRGALPIEIADSGLEPGSGVRSVGPRLRATIASYRCTRALERQDFEAARLEYWMLQQALDELHASASELAVDESAAALQVRARELGRMLAMRITPRDFKRSEP